MENLTNVPNDGVTGVFISEREPRLTWLPHVLLTAFMVGLLALSFLNFHMRYRDRYLKRSEIARQESNGSICSVRSRGSYNDTGISPFLRTILEDSYRDEILPSAIWPEEKQLDDETKTDVDFEARQSTSNQHLPFADGQLQDLENGDLDSPPDGALATVKASQPGGATKPAMTLNDRQCLTFKKRDSRLFALGARDSSPHRWVSIRDECWWATKEPSRSHRKAAPPIRTGLFSYMTSRFKEGERRPISVNLWTSTSARRHRRSSKHRANAAAGYRGRSGILHL